MIRGIISKIDLDSKTVDVIFPAHDNVTIQSLPLQSPDFIDTLSINDIVAVVTSLDLNDSLVLNPVKDR